MSIKKRGLGRGLGDLGLGDLLSKPSSFLPQHGLRKIAVELLRPNKYQPRQDVDSANLHELAESIKTQGIIQPILVRHSTLIRTDVDTVTTRIATKHSKESVKEYEIVAGERRWRAAQLAGLSEVPILVRELSDEQAAALALIENVQREDLNALDIAQGLQRLIDKFGMTHQAVATAIGKSRVTITNLLRLLSLSDAIRNMLHSGALEVGHARALLTLLPHQQLQTANQIVVQKLSVRATEELVRKVRERTETTGRVIETKLNKKTDPDIVHLQNKLRDTFGAKIKIYCSTKGKGRLVIYYNSLSELDGILEHIE